MTQPWRVKSGGSPQSGEAASALGSTASATAQLHRLGCVGHGLGCLGHGLGHGRGGRDRRFHRRRHGLSGRLLEAEQAEPVDGVGQEGDAARDDGGDLSGLGLGLGIGLGSWGWGWG